MVGDDTSFLKPQNSRFEATPWNLVRLTSDAKALNLLLTQYWKPLYFFVRRHGYDNQTSKDIVQEFIAMILEREVLAKADPARGRFRTFLLAALGNFIKDWEKAAGREKRGSGRKHFTLDFALGEAEYAKEAAAAESPEVAMNRAWARGLWDRALRELKGDPAHLDAFRMYLKREPYEAIAKKTGLSEAAAKSAVHRLNGQLRDIITGYIRETVSDEGELRSELNEFITLIS